MVKKCIWYNTIRKLVGLISAMIYKFDSDPVARNELA